MSIVFKYSFEPSIYFKATDKDQMCLMCSMKNIKGSFMVQLLVDLTKKLASFHVVTLRLLVEFVYDIAETVRLPHENF